MRFENHRVVSRRDDETQRSVAVKKPELPSNEDYRLRALRELDLLDTPREERFDRITSLTRRLLDVPIAAISLIDADRQWFKSVQGLAVQETPRSVSFCGHAILARETFVVADAAGDQRFADNPLVQGEPHIRFYAGRPVSLPDGHQVGALCVIDRKPRDFSPEERGVLEELAEMVERELAVVALSTSDAQTGLSNRRGFVMLGEQVLSVARRGGSRVAILEFGLEDFAEARERFGRVASELLARAAAGVLRCVFRDSDVVARVEPDLFRALLIGPAERDVYAILGRLEKRCALHNSAAGQRVPLEFTIGFACRDEDEDVDLEGLIGDASARRVAASRSKRARRG